MKYKPELYIITKEDPIERINIPIRSFEVVGGANRTINFNSTDEISISSEFEQARTYKHIIFLIPPTQDFLAVKLINLNHNFQFFDMTFAVSIYSGGKMIQSLRLSSEGAWFMTAPSPVGSSPPSLKAQVKFHEAHLLYGKFEGRYKKVVYKEI